MKQIIHGSDCTITRGEYVASLHQLLHEALVVGTSTERRILRHLLQDYPLACLDTVAEIGQQSDTSGPSVVRLIKKMGFDSHVAFRQAVRDELRELLLTQQGSAPKASTVPAPVQLANSIDASLASLRDQGQDDVLVGLLADRRRRIICQGGNVSHALAVYFARHLLLLRPNVVVLDPGPASASAIVDLRSSDVVIVFDFRPHERIVDAYPRAIKARRAFLVAVTDPHLSPIMDYADRTIVAQVNGLTEFDSLAPAMVVLESLITTVEARLGHKVRERVDEIQSVRVALSHR